MDTPENQSPTVEQLLRVLAGVDFELRNVGVGILYRLETAQEKLDPAHPASQPLAEAKMGVDALMKLQYQLHLHIKSLWPRTPGGAGP